MRGGRTCYEQSYADRRYRVLGEVRPREPVQGRNAADLSGAVPVHRSARRREAQEQLRVTTRSTRKHALNYSHYSIVFSVHSSKLRPQHLSKKKPTSKNMLTDTVKVSTKGQIVIPKEIRDELGIQPADKLQVISDGKEIRIEKFDKEAFLQRINEKRKISHQALKESGITEEDIIRIVKEVRKDANST